jgi:hypothetical protein
MSAGLAHCLALPPLALALAAGLRPSAAQAVGQLPGADRGDAHGVTGRWDIALRDLDFALGLDADGDGEITWGECAPPWRDRRLRQCAPGRAGRRRPAR